MEIVSARTDEDIAREDAANRLRKAAKRLSANLLRVVRGAGEPFQMFAQCHEYLEAAQQFFDTHRMWPTHETVEAICIRRLDPLHTSDAGIRSDSSYDRDVWLHEMMEGALQVAASAILGQSTQRVAGTRQMQHGIREIVRQREETRTPKRR
jgi:hypothetical protein